MKNAEQTLSGDMILKEVWAKVSRNATLVRSYIRNLRDKLSDNPPQIILTERGEGYRFVSSRLELLIFLPCLQWKNSKTTLQTDADPLMDKNPAAVDSETRTQGGIVNRSWRRAT